MAKTKRRRYLSQFFCVTKSGALYRVVIRGRRQVPRIEKLRQEGSTSTDVEVGSVTVGFYLVVGQCLLLHHGTGKCAWTHGTSPVIALFCKESDALMCLERSDLKPCDLRWKKETAEVLRRIGKEGKYFQVSLFRTLG